MPAPLLLDLSHTCHSQARTGIQRVTRSLHAALGSRALPITHDPYAQTWRTLEPWEQATLATDGAGKKRGAKWPLRARLRGELRRVFGKPAQNVAAIPVLPENSGLLVPEVFSPAVAAALPAVLAAARGPRVAVFHDAIALKFPELSPPKTVARFPAYLVELLAFDGIAANSEDSRASLVDYWRWLGAKNPPPVASIPLGVDFKSASFAAAFSDSATSATPPAQANAATSPATPLTILSVGSIEGRKNHLALLNACETLWAKGATFSLHLIGLAQPQTGAAALALIRELQAAGRPLRYDGPVDDRTLNAAYAACAFTVYPSLIEGFGLPVLESLAHGKPCICSGRGALGESARGGGCLVLDRVDAPALAAAIAQLTSSAEQRARLSGEARARTFRTWTDYATELAGWTHTLTRRN